jgi:hypothetical protein
VGIRTTPSIEINPWNWVFCGIQTPPGPERKDTAGGKISAELNLNNDVKIA